MTPLAATEDARPKGDLKPEQFTGKRFLVTGGAGFIGSHLVERLVGLGGQVVVVDDLSTGRKENLEHIGDGVKLIQRDVREFDYDEAGPLDCIFNEAARALIPSFKDPLTDLAVNTGNTIRILEYARKSGVRVVHASSGSVYGNPVRIPIDEDHPLNPISPYAASKLSAEHYCILYHGVYGVDVCMLRYFNVYGPRQNVSEDYGVIPIFVHRALNNAPLTIFGDGRQTRDFLHVEDVVRANLLAYTAPRMGGQILNVGGGGKEVSILELSEMVMSLCGVKVPVVFASPKPGDISRLAGDSSRAGRLIGYSATVSLADGLERYVAYARGVEKQSGTKKKGEEEVGPGRGPSDGRVPV
ncbi:MAG: NAD-dependent epimerase/dehydratase family protein [Thaumarchaeota archaeon]|nr:NAD-dependent epimerase/dehydratase family protein [Nitrososphaerota archaeon]